MALSSCTDHGAFEPRNASKRSDAEHRGLGFLLPYGVAECFLLLVSGVATVFSVAGNTGFSVARVFSVAAQAGCSALPRWCLLLLERCRMLLPGVLRVRAVFSVPGVVFLVAAAPADTRERGEIGGWCLALPHDRACISIVCRRINVDYKV